MRGVKDMGTYPWGHVIGNAQRREAAEEMAEIYSRKEALHNGGLPSTDNPQ